MSVAVFVLVERLSARRPASPVFTREAQMKSKPCGEFSRSLFRARRSWAAPSITLAFLVGCGAAPGEPDALDTGGEAAQTQPEDGLKEAYALFREQFVGSDLDARYQLGFGFHPGMATEKVVGASGLSAGGQVNLDMNSGKVSAFLANLPQGATFDLWLVKNVAGAGRSAVPEAGDQFVNVGRFVGTPEFQTLEADLGFEVHFDLDLVVVTRGGKTPVQSRIAVGERTILEKRLFRFRQDETLDAVIGPVADDIETNDPLVARGAELFFNETFGGNGRTCGTCHRADNNLTIDPAFIATLPQSDPLFVAENNPALAKLENPELLRTRGLILENVDGFENPTRKFVMRGVPHTLSLGLTNNILTTFGGPPDHRLGWSGDGGPGRSTLQQFAFGAIMQHFTKNLARRPGVDFRLPTQEELDALEAFQLFTGRQTPVDFLSRAATDPRAANGENLFLGVGCTNCHTDLSGFVNGFGSNFNTGVRNLTPELAVDDGLASPGDGTFDVPPLAEAADTAPFFHNNAAATIEDAVAFYFSQTFRDSPSSFFIFGDPSVEELGDMAAFLRVVNASTNLSQVRKRAEYARTHRSPGNTDLLTIALADAEDARVVLADKNLNRAVRNQIRDAEALLRTARGQADDRRPATLRRAIALLDQASEGLFSPLPPGSGGTGGVGGGPGVGGSAGMGASGGTTGGTGGSAGMGTGGFPAGTGGVGGSVTPGAGGSVSVGGGPGMGATGGTGGSSGGSGGAGGTSGGAGGSGGV
jgi:hypothetical protein